MRALKGVVTDVTDGLQIKLENGPSIRWPVRAGRKLGDKVLIFYNFEKGRIVGMAKESEMTDIAELEERYYETVDEEIDYEAIFDRLEHEEANG